MSAAGNHIFVIPAGFSTSERVVTSNVRHPSAVILSANTARALEREKPATATPVDHKKSRRFMIYPQEAWACATTAVIVIPHKGRSQCSTRLAPVKLYTAPVAAENWTLESHFEGRGSSFAAMQSAFTINERPLGREGSVFNGRDNLERTLW
jgi:hypothetical protein